MADVVSKQVRSRMMSGIRCKNTKPELIIRRGLHARGFRFRLHDKRLPGNPDIVFPKHKAVILVHGCFWHGHECHLFKWPKSREEFWRSKIEGNRDRDIRVRDELITAGYRVRLVWECEIRSLRSSSTLIDELAAWLGSD